MQYQKAAEWNPGAYEMGLLRLISQAVMKLMMNQKTLLLHETLNNSKTV